ncbi:MAG: hypothetical protein JF603_02880 [Acidobacteria bacterium]|nr:hypothetical protein [Acidobacteriota bacterium]
MEERVTGHANTSGQGVDYGAEARFDDSPDATHHRSSGCRYHVEYGTHGEAPSTGAITFMVYCGDTLIRSGWRMPNERDAADAMPIVQRLIDRLEVEDKSIDIRPNHAGVVAVPAYYWVTGYDGGDVSQTDTVGGIDITVTAHLTNVVWNFGDEADSQHGGLGQPWPQRSDVHHSYRYPAPAGDPYVITATLWFQPTFTVGGQPGAALDPFPVTFTRAYPVREIQAVQHH